MSPGSAALLGIALGAALVLVLLTILVFRRRIDLLDQRLHELQRASDRQSWYADLKRDQSVIKLLQSLLELNNLLRRSPHYGSGKSTEDSRP